MKLQKTLCVCVISLLLLGSASAQNNNKKNKNKNNNVDDGVNRTELQLIEAKEKLREEYILRDFTCKHGCVPYEDVILIWCAQQVQYTFCNRTIVGPYQDAVRKMEEGAINAYMSIIRKVGGLKNDDCKSALRNWMCWEFFNRCTTDNTKYYPVCHSSCYNAKLSCGLWFVDCNEELEEAYDEYKQFANIDDRGRYRRGQGTPIFSKDAMSCTGGADSFMRPAPMLFLFVIAVFLTSHIR